MAIEDTMAQMAHSQITQSLPSMTEDIQGFQIIDTNEEINSAIGVIVGLVGNMVVYVPAVYRRGKIYNMDIMYIPEIRQWLPTHDNWLTYIRSRRADLDAVIKDRDNIASKGKATNINLDVVELDSKLTSRAVNEGFSGGEKKKNEIFQMAMLEPKLSILDETDSGLDIDALRIVATGVTRLKTKENATVVITHYQRLLDYIVPDYVHVLYKGRIIYTGDKSLALKLEKEGYDWLINDYKEE